MNFRLLTPGALLGAVLLVPSISMAGDFEDAVKRAEAAIDNAGSAGYEWRDSRKILKQAKQARKAGDHDKAMKLVEKARMQGVVALAQSKKEKNYRQP